MNPGQTGRQSNPQRPNVPLDQPAIARSVTPQHDGRGDSQAAMLSVVPMVVDSADEVLAGRANNKQQLTARPSQRNQEFLNTRQAEVCFRGGFAACSVSGGGIILVGTDPSGQMKTDFACAPMSENKALGRRSMPNSKVVSWTTFVFVFTTF